jgi:hypothetical protein
MHATDARSIEVNGFSLNYVIYTYEIHAWINYIDVASICICAELLTLLYQLYIYLSVYVS